MLQVTRAEGDAVGAFHGHGARLSNQGPLVTVDVTGCDGMASVASRRGCSEILSGWWAMLDNASRRASSG